MARAVSCPEDAALTLGRETNCAPVEYLPSTDECCEPALAEKVLAEQVHFRPAFDLDVAVDNRAARQSHG